MIAGESSGDVLGSRVIRALRRQFPGRSLHLEGVGGQTMEAEGFQSLYPMERLAVMGLIEPLGRLPELLRIRRELYTRWSASPPAFFLGIDAPDFNLALARRLRKGGLRTAQLVSPTVWAWRQGRVHTVAKSVDSLLCLFPFEPPLYSEVALSTTFVGHPLVAELQNVPSREAVRRELGIDPQAPVVALLPGSRGSEVAQLGQCLIDAGRMLRSRDARRQLLMPAANGERLLQCRELLRNANAEGEVRLLEGQSRDAMIAADVVVLASGTATLEAMLLQRPMVVAYRVAKTSWALMSRLAVTPFVALPNILAKGSVVPELLQDNLTPSALALEAEILLAHGDAQVKALRPCVVAMERDFDAALGPAMEALLREARDTVDKAPGTPR
ncbi:lipid-A-disaccharide synthase [Congregibacter litoralis KT71]|uniref:Lipid-A-disaccharide synthase n=2 Tax=Congregibacter TaxID=393661 RepID=A4ACZ0_9GAMM|nr:lipid-A-disaccharide synthase [Congregibacter litoralis KT71]